MNCVSIMYIIKTEVLLICFANKGVNHRRRKSRSGIPRDSPRFVFQFAGNRDQVFLATPLGLFSNLPGLLPITSCVKPTKPAKWNYGGYCCLPIFTVCKTQKSVIVTDSAREILLSGAWICQEGFIRQLDYTPCCETITLFLRFFCHIQKGRREATER